MAKFGLGTNSFASPSATVVTDSDTAVSIEMAANEIAEVVECIMTGSGTDAAADTPHTAVGRFCDFTTAGTATSTTPEPMDGTTAALAAGDVVYTAEPTAINTVSALIFGFNMRGGMRWAVPKGEGFKVIGGLTEDGFVWGVLAQAAGQVDATIQWWE